MNDGSPMMHHRNGYGNGYIVSSLVDRSRHSAVEINQASAGRSSGALGHGAPRRWHARRDRQPKNKNNTAFDYESDDSSLSSNASGSNKSSEKGEGSSRSSHSSCPTDGVTPVQMQQREWRARPRRDLRPRRIASDRFHNTTYPYQVKFAPDDLLNGSEWDTLSQEIWDKFITSQQTEETFRKKMNLWRYLYITIRSIFPRYGLYVVGSTMSGFGLDNSDMDLCLYVRTLVQVEPRAHALVHLSYVLEYIRSFDPGAELIHAKVPILKFRDVRNGLQVDLNCNNVVGIKNTNLLNCYSRMDWRVRPLVAMMKLWARAHRINDARHRTLSSYSLTLMVIHFLQCGTNPPVLVRAGTALPDRRAYNRTTLAELFLNMLKYYAEFPYEHMAVSVRTARRLPLSECRMHDPHQWKLLCVEEPFDLSNTARSVYDPEMFEKIVHTFKESYKRLAVGLRLADAWPAPAPER